MNDLITELIEKATTKESFYPAGCNGYTEDSYSFNKEKFAELIIKECLMEVWYDATPRQISHNIKSKFGIKE